MGNRAKKNKKAVKAVKKPSTLVTKVTTPDEPTKVEEASAGGHNGPSKKKMLEGVDDDTVVFSERTIENEISLTRLLDKRRFKPSQCP